jgi:peptidoglycan hydrolase-like protein with peptidoglycan-binding domain
MKKRTLQEEIDRIHTITYGKKVLFEDELLDKLLQGDSSPNPVSKIDDPTKADLVSNDVQDFYNTIQKSIENGGLKQQSLGSMTYQKEVESMQIGLMLLSYDLPKHGVDGLFGPETSSAVSKFIDDNQIQSTNESKITIKGLMEALLDSPLSSTSINSSFGQRGARNHPGVDLAATSNSDVKSPASGKVIDAAIRNDACGGTLFIDHGNGFKSRFCHLKELLVQNGDSITQGQLVARSGGDQTAEEGRGRSSGAHLHFELYKDGQLVDPIDYIDNNGIKATSGGSTVRNVNASPEMLTKLLELLKEKNITSEQLKQYIDKVVTGGGNQFTDLDLTKSEDVEKYGKICQRFIDTRKPNLLNITGTMMATAAKQAFDRYQKFVPAELALAQLATEGGIGNNNPNSRPIKTRNPFNVGNTDNGGNVFHNDVQSGINTYYNLIAKSYLGKGKTANDLVSNFVNHSGLRYAGPDYEKSVNSIALQANKIAKTVS